MIPTGPLGRFRNRGLRLSPHGGDNAYTSPGYRRSTRASSAGRHRPPGPLAPFLLRAWAGTSRTAGRLGRNISVRPYRTLSRMIVSTMKRSHPTCSTAATVMTSVPGQSAVVSDGSRATPSPANARPLVLMMKTGSRAALLGSDRTQDRPPAMSLRS